MLEINLISLSTSPRPEPLTCTQLCAGCPGLGGGQQWDSLSKAQLLAQEHAEIWSETHIPGQNTRLFSGRSLASLSPLSPPRNTPSCTIPSSTAEGADTSDLPRSQREKYIRHHHLTGHLIQATSISPCSITPGYS